MTAEEIVQMDHVVSIADFALKLREKLRDINADLNTNYQMKIGQFSLRKHYVWTCKCGTYVKLNPIWENYNIII